MERYVGLFTSLEDVRREFAVGEDAPFPRDEQIIMAAYDVEGYEGSVLVLYRGDDGQLYEVNGSHCSCYGLEDQWEPEVTSAEALRMRKTYWATVAVRDYTDALGVL
jgi:hypothetical protein